jgi:hypothetical protein
METKSFRKNIVYRVRTINGQNILFGDNQCFQLNEIAAIIWNNLNGENTIADIANIIAEEYSVDKEVIMDDVNSFISEMIDCNVILEN